MKYFLLIFLLLISFNAKAFESNCKENYLNGKIPNIQFDKEICFNEFVVLFDEKNKIPVYTSQYLTNDEIIKSTKIDRKNTFHSEMHIGLEDPIYPNDYKNSGYDKGHMVPAGDMPTLESQYQSFSMVNITPQTPELNRGQWKELEEYIRSLVLEEESVYVVTGSILLKENNYIFNNIRIPNKIYKAIYIPRTKETAVFVGNNDNIGEVENMPLKQFKKKYNINPF